MKDLLSGIQERRSFYAISKKSNISDDQVRDLVEAAVKHTPSAYNMQSQRAVLLLGPENDKLWEIVMNALRAKVPAERFAKTEEKINGFAASYGSVLFFDDTAVTDSFARQFDSYEGQFTGWALQANGMLQINIWNLLEGEGFGASLQHYNPLIDEAVKRAWGLPESWKLLAQMPFGVLTGVPKEKEFVPIDERFKVFG